MSRSALRHVGRDLTGEKVLTHWSEEVDHLCVLWEESFVLDPTGYYGDVSGLNRSLLCADTSLIEPLINQTNCSCGCW